MSEEQNERIDTLEHQVEALAYRVAELERMTSRYEEFFEKVFSEFSERLQTFAMESIQQIQTQTMQAEETVRAIYTDSGAMLSTEQLLKLYDERIAGSGKSLKAWLEDLRAEHRYPAVVALRARRKRQRKG